MLIDKQVWTAKRRRWRRRGAIDNARCTCSFSGGVVICSAVRKTRSPIKPGNHATAYSRTQEYGSRSVCMVSMRHTLRHTPSDSIRSLYVRHRPASYFVQTPRTDIETSERVRDAKLLPERAIVDELGGRARNTYHATIFIL
jgi:hypothetical protein